VTLDPNRPTPQVSNIAQSILSELDRVRGIKLTLTIDIDAEAAEGFPEDVESVVRDNAASLQIADFRLNSGSKSLKKLVCICELQKDLKESAKLLIEDELQEFGDLQGMDCGIARLARLRGCRKVSR
jgi:hypothetical protein